MSKQLKKQLNALTAQVAALKVGKQQQPAPAKRKRNRKRKGPSPLSNTGISSDGRIVVSRCELLFEVTVDAAKDSAAFYYVLQASANRMPWLSKLAKNFSQIVWRSARLEYRPAVGTMKDGSLVIGIDWNPVASAPDKAKVQSMTPNFQVPVWQKKELTIPSQRLMSRKYYSTDSSSNVQLVDKVPCEVLGYLSCTADDKNKQYFGDIWIHYNVILQGPQ